MQQIYAKRKRGDRKDDFFRAIALNFDILEEQKEANGCEKTVGDWYPPSVSSIPSSPIRASIPEAEIRTRTEEQGKDRNRGSGRGQRTSAPDRWKGMLP
ncbi:MAG: hypothetical protein V8R94_10940 [Lachnospiraceae bacterium]